MKVKELITYLRTQDPNEPMIGRLTYGQIIAMLEERDPEDEIKVQIHDKLYTLEKGTLQ